MLEIAVLIATTTGNAKFIAEEVGEQLAERARFALYLMDQCDVEAIVAARALLVVSSTFGTGDIPDNGHALFRSLSERRPDLSLLRFGVIGLGDSTYSHTFAFGGRKWSDLFEALGATRLGDMLVLDAPCGGPVTERDEQAAIAWTRLWIEAVAEPDAAISHRHTPGPGAQLDES